MKKIKHNQLITMLLLVMTILVPIGALAQTDYDKSVTFEALDGNPEGYDGEKYDNLFDGKKTENDFSKWCCSLPTSDPAYVIFKASKTGVPVGYTITTGNDNNPENGRNPKSWKLYGNNEGKDGAWTLIAEVTDDQILEDKNYTSYDFTCTGATSYLYFKWEISATQSSPTLQVGEFALKLMTCSHLNPDGTSALGETISTVAATCTKPAYTTHKCSLCEGIVEKVTNPALAPHALMHHEKVVATCTSAGYIEYWQCAVCNKLFNDQDATTEIADAASIAVPATEHNYDENDKCTKCQQEIPFVILGNNTITIEETTGSRDEISGYSLYKYTATEDGTLEVMTICDADTYGTLWASRSAEKYLALNDDGGNVWNFKIIHTVTKDSTYYIGVRQHDGKAIEGSVKLNVKLNGIDCELPEDMTGKGTEAEPFVLKTVEHLGWFRDYVNDLHAGACAKISDDVEEIDMSSVCHQANDAENVEELSWTPIGNTKVQYQGTFDGNGKTIKNLYISLTSENTGFFGYATTDGCLKNITFDNANVTSTASNTGILVGNTLCTIQGIKTTETCSVKGEVYTGGIAGRSAKCDIVNCENRATVNGSRSVGGIAGRYENLACSITSCANYGTVTGTEASVGGIVGYFDSGTIQNSANYGNIQGEYNVGNLIGFADICNLNNVLGTGNISETETHTDRIGMLVGYVDDFSSTAKGILAYNNSATVTIAGTMQTGNDVKAFGDGTMTFSDGKTEADVIKPFTAEQLQSGEVAYLLNGETSEGTMAWYQKLGTDAYPILTAAEGNTVYKGNFAYCDGTTTTYSNSASEGEQVHKYSLTLTTPTFDADKHIYYIGCRTENCPLHKYVADAAGTIEAELEGTEFVVTDMKLDDATLYDSKAKFTATACNYNRTFSNDKWQSMYVPFGFNSSDLSDEYELAVINNFHEYELTDGTYNVVLEVKRVTKSTNIPALTPCLIRQKKAPSETKTETFTFSNVAFSPAEDKSINCSSVTRYYEFTGTLGGKTGFDESKDYVLNKGELFMASEQTTLKPQRWYLSVADRNSSIVELQKARSISIRVIGNSDATGIDEIYVNTEKASDSVQGIYDLQGRKLGKAPVRGMYIMNGKKYIK